jgi:hypothetical protein
MRIHVSVRTVASMKLAAVRRHVAIGGVGAAWKLETNDRVDPRCYKGGVARCEIEEHPGNGSFGRLSFGSMARSMPIWVFLPRNVASSGLAMRSAPNSDAEPGIPEGSRAPRVSIELEQIEQVANRW